MNTKHGSLTSVFFDESGFTGNGLLDDKQHYFSYASVVCSPDEAKEFTDRIIKKYKIQNKEIKANKLLRRTKGKQAIDEIITEFQGRFKGVVSDKKFALAGKFFEYIFEPALSEINRVLYKLKFHLFVSNVLYIFLITNSDKGAEQILTEFQSLMRREMGEDDINAFFSNFENEGNHSGQEQEILQMIRNITSCNREYILDEMASSENTPTGKWILDLTTASLFNLLCEWGEEYEQLCVYCDSSKPLVEQADYLDVMIGRNDKKLIEINGNKIPITFNLNGPINFADSLVCHGIQIADAIAGAYAFTFNPKNSDDEFAIKWKDTLSDHAINYCIFPDYSYLDMSDLNVQLNALILMELAERASKGTSLTEGLIDFIRGATIQLRLDPIQFEE